MKMSVKLSQYFMIIFIHFTITKMGNVHTHTFSCLMGTFHSHNDFYTVQTLYSMPLHFYP